MRIIVHTIFWILTFIQSIVWWSIIWPIDLIKKFLVFESTQQEVSIWLDDKKEKVRLRLEASSYRPKQKDSVAVKVDTWKSIVEHINKELEK